MESILVQREKVTTTDGLCLSPDMQVRIGAFVVYRPQPSDYRIEIRIFIGTELEFKQTESPRFLSIQHFDSPLLSEIIGNVIVPAQELLKWHGDTPEVFHKAIVRTVLSSELQEVRFILGQSKKTCELWFRCLKVRPQATIPKYMLMRDTYFCQAG